LIDGTLSGPRPAAAGSVEKVTTRDARGRSIDEAEDALLAAMRVSDVAALAELIDADLVFTGPDGMILSKEADLEAHGTGAVRFERIAEIERRTTEHAGQGSTETIVEAVILDAGRRVEATLRYERLWRIITGSWQVTQGSVTPLP
jgi:ketosteroid isomerase-like protein